MKKHKKIISSIITLIILMILSILGVDFNSEFFSTVNVANIENLENITIKTSKTIQGEMIPTNKQNLQVYFFDVGQADSILIMNEDKVMLIDAGNNEDGELIVESLQTLGISKIDYLIGTHPHEDHIGGLDNVIKNFEIGTIYMPKAQTNTKTFEEVLDAISDKNLKITSSKVNDMFKVGNAECKVLSIKNDVDDLNSSSIVIKMEFEKTKYLFMGDAEADIEENLAIDKVNILKAGHHGSNTSSTQEFINKVAPEVAVICVGKDNNYGHPSTEVIERLEKINSKIYRTDEVGHIFIEQSVNI